MYMQESHREHCSGSVVKCLTREQKVACSIGSPAALGCVLEQDTFNPCLVLVQPRKTCLDITEKLLTGM